MLLIFITISNSFRNFYQNKIFYGKNWIRKGNEIWKLHNAAISNERMTTTGEFLTKAVVKWLNSEFYPDPNHSTIGTLIGSVFFESMEKNPVFDVHNFALHLKPMLQRNQKADWSTHTEDICNKVTRIISFIETLDRRKVPDFISTLAESCGLLQPEILEPPTSLFSWAMLKKVSFNLSGQFDRCTFLTLLLDGEKSL